MYALLLQQIEHDVRSDRQIIAGLIAAGVKGLDVPDFTAERDRFDAALNSEPEHVDNDRLELLRELGLR